MVSWLKCLLCAVAKCLLDVVLGVAGKWPQSRRGESSHPRTERNKDTHKVYPPQNCGKAAWVHAKGSGHATNLAHRFHPQYPHILVGPHQDSPGTHPECLAHMGGAHGLHLPGIVNVVKDGGMGS